MGELINYDSASKFLNSIQDPIVQSLIRSSYQMICMSSEPFEGELDLRFFFHIMEEFLRNREALAKALMGDFGEDKTGWGS